MRDRLLLSWARFVLRHPRTLLGLILLTTAGALAVVPGLRVEAGHSKLEDKDNVHQKRFAAFLREFGSPNQLIVIASGGTERLRRQALDELAALLPARRAVRPDESCRAEEGPHAPACVRDVVGRIDLEQLKSRALLYAPLDQVKGLSEALQSEEFGLHTLMGLDSLPAMLRAVTAELERRAEGPPPGPEVRKRAEQMMGAVERLFDEFGRRVRVAGRQKVPLEEALFPRAVQSGIDARGYFSSPDGALKVAFVRPVDDSDEPAVVCPFVDYVRAHAGTVEKKLNAGLSADAAAKTPLKLTLTGLPAIVADETDIVADDVLLTSVAATLGILLLFYIGFRSIRQTIMGLLPLLVGLIWTLAFVYLAYDVLNLVTSAFIVTLLGLGIDFAVHILSRYNESRRGGATPEQAAEAAVIGAGPGILTGALTTSGAFIALAASRFMAFSQLGIITGVGLICVLICTFTMLPAMLVLPSLRFFSGGPRPHAAARPFFGLSDLVVRRYRLFVVGGLLVSAGMLVAAQRIPWSYNYMDLMPEGLESVQAMDTLSRNTDFSAESAAVVADSLEEARRYAAELTKKKTISRVESLVSYLPAQQQQKLAALQPLAALLRDGPTPAAKPFQLDAFNEALQELADALEDAQFEAKRGGAEAEAKLLDRPLAAVRRLQQAVKQTEPKAAQERLAALQQEVLAGIRKGLSILEDNVTAKPLTVHSLLAALPSSVRDRLYANGRFAIYVYPSQSIWEKSFMRQLVGDLRSVDPEATGFPVTHWETSNSIERGFRDASIIAFLALFVLLMVDFRSLRYTLLAAAPLVMGIAWMWGSISLLGMSYNFVNVIAFPLIIGIGVASGVHILHRYRQEGERDVATVVRHTGVAILLSAATTMVGFGSLTIAHHRGAASLGIVLLVGVGACLVTAISFLPALLHWLQQRRA